MSPEDIAETLGERQKQGIIKARLVEPGDWIVPTGLGRGLVPAGLAKRSIDGIILNDLGLRVRQHLRGPKQALDA